MGFFEGIKTAQAYNSAGYFPAGFDGITQIDVCKANDGHNGLFFIVEFEILSTNVHSPDVGEKRAWLQKLTGDARLPGLGTIKTFIRAALGCPNGDPRLDDELEKVCDYIVSDENPLLERCVRTAAVNKTKKKGDKGDFTNHNFYPIDGAPYDLEGFLQGFEQYKRVPQITGAPILSPDGSMMFVNGAWIPVPRPTSAKSQPQKISPDGRYGWFGGPTWVLL